MIELGLCLGRRGEGAAVLGEGQGWRWVADWWSENTRAAAAGGRG